MAKHHKEHGERASLSVPTVTQRGMGSIVRRESKQKTAKGTKAYSQYWIYVPADLAEDKAFPFKPGEKLLIAVTPDRRLTVEKA